jgi:hypothetical protein
MFTQSIVAAERAGGASAASPLVSLDQRLAQAAGETRPTPDPGIDHKPLPQPGMPDEVLQEVTLGLANYAVQHPNASGAELNDEMNRLFSAAFPQKSPTTSQKQLVASLALEQLETSDCNQAWSASGMGKLQLNLLAQAGMERYMMNRIMNPERPEDED